MPGGNGLMTEEKDMLAEGAGEAAGAGSGAGTVAGAGAGMPAAAAAPVTADVAAVSAGSSAISGSSSPAPSSVTFAASAAPGSSAPVASAPAPSPATPAAGEPSVPAAPDPFSASEPRKIEDVLAAEGFYLVPPVGVSMWPMLRNRHDVIMVVPAARELRRYDVALYRRGEKYVLHRVVGRYENGSEKGYVICGDNCVTLEYIPRENVLGVLSGFYRDGHRIDCETSRGYHAYSKLWVALYPARKVCKSASAAVRHVGKRVLLACGLRKCKGADDVAVGGAVDGVAEASGSAGNAKREAGRKR